MHSETRNIFVRTLRGPKRTTYVQPFALTVMLRSRTRDEPTVDLEEVDGR